MGLRRARQRSGRDARRNYIKRQEKIPGGKPLSCFILPANYPADSPDSGVLSWLGAWEGNCADQLIQSSFPEPTALMGSTRCVCQPPSVPELMDSQGKAALPGKGWRSVSSPTGTSRAQPSIPGTRRILSLGTAGGETGSQGHDSIGNTKGFGVSRWGTRPWVTAAPGVTPALSPRRH